MVAEMGAVGDVALAAMTARAVEPGHGEHGGQGAHDETCLNCGTTLLGEFCHACGQHGHLHRSISAIWHDIAHGVLHFEGKTWATLPLLAWKPGELTRRYIHGERAKFVSPMALFLFSVFLMFGVIQALGGSLQTPQVSAEGRQEASAAIARDIAANERLAAGLETERAAAARAGTPTAEIDARIRATRAEIAAERTAQRAVQAAGPIDIGGIDDGFTTGWKRLDKGIAKARENPNLALYKVQTNAYKFSWALIPISVPFVWLMFAWRRRFRVYDHGVFVTYSLSFMTLMGVVLTVAWAIGLSSAAAWGIAMFLPPVHMYRQLRGAYGLSRINALLRMIVLVTFANIAITIFFLLLLAIGALG